MSRPTLFESQTNALLTLLNLNQPPPTASSSAGPFPRPSSPSSTFDENAQAPLVWKVLILDDLSKDILATSLRVQDLREQGVTLHMQLHSNRPPLADVPAVYFVSPTIANIRRIAEVCDLSLCPERQVADDNDLVGSQPCTLLFLLSLIHLVSPSFIARRARVPHSGQ